MGFRLDKSFDSIFGDEKAKQSAKRKINLENEDYALYYLHVWYILFISDRHLSIESLNQARTWVQNLQPSKIPRLQLLPASETASLSTKHGWVMP